MNTWDAAAELTAIDGLDAIRKRPHLYAGHPSGEPPGGSYYLLASTATALAPSKWGTTRVAVSLHPDGAISVRADDDGLPSDPVRSGGIVRPRFDHYMLEASSHSRPGLADAPDKTWGPFADRGALLNGLSDRLLVCTVRDGLRYRAVFHGGAYAVLLHETGPAAGERGTSLTFLPVEALRPASWSLAAAERAIASFDASADEPRGEIRVTETGPADWR